MLEINGMKFEFDMSDADTYEAYMAHAGNVDEVTSKKIPDNATTEEYVALIREKCSAVRTFVDGILGEGAGEKLCPKDSWNKCERVLIEITDDVYRQIEEDQKWQEEREKIKEEREILNRKLKLEQKIETE